MTNLKNCSFLTLLSFVFVNTFFNLVKVTEWPPIGKIAAHSAYDMFHGISA